MLGPRPGARKRANKLNVSGLGRSLVNQQKKDQKNQSSSERYTTEVNPYGSGSTLQSVTEQRPLDELLSTVELAGKDFTTERTAAIKVVHDASSNSARLSREDREQLVRQHYENAGKLTVPRRPQWSRDMTAHELDQLEKEAFLAWRRSLASLQENPQLRLALTPFERNLEVWRQLWRVLERSHLIVQIVDARNPMLYRSEDLDNYVRSFPGKKPLLLINKADLLTVKQREIWRDYLTQQDIPFAFFSAKQASAENELAEANKTRHYVEVASQHESPDSILSVNQLEDLFKRSAPEVEQNEQLQIGLVGYPNVGKSSTINALIGAKKVSVSSTPGKTKHFQTINLTKDLMLCDCPGLVFPNFAQTKAELVCQGVLPIDQLRDYMGPSQLVVERIPKSYLERTYHITLHTNPVTALDLLETYAAYRGYTRTGGGMPDSSRAARIILKDYVNAKISFCMPPPSYEGSPQTFNMELYDNMRASASSGSAGSRNLTDDEQPATDPSQELEEMSLEEASLENELDQGFFAGRIGTSKSSLPFHRRANEQPTSSKSSKKHNKGRKSNAISS